LKRAPRLSTTSGGERAACGLALAVLLTAGALVAWITSSAGANAGPRHRSGASSLGDPLSVYLPLLFRNEPPAVPFGIQVFPGQLDEPDVAMVGEAGARWIRVPFAWSWVEPYNTTPDNYVWPSGPAYLYYDEGIADYSSHGIQVILTFAGNPGWAATYSGGPIDKVPIGELVDFMDAAVRHYAAPPYNVRYWEFYNEPDNGIEARAAQGLSWWGHTPQAYAELLAAVYPAMKAAYPEAQIVLGGLAYDWFEEDEGPYVRAFLDGVLDNGGADYFDVMNFHYYPAFRDKWDPYGPGIIGKATYLRDKLATYGVQKPFFCTETSMWSDEFNGGSHELQSRYVVQVYARSKAAELLTTIWFWLADTDAYGEYKYGLLNPDLSPKPSYTAYQTLAGQLTDAQYVRTLSPEETGSAEIEAYDFFLLGGSTRIVVAWTNDGLDHDMAFQASQVVVVQKDGSQASSYDDDGDGWVHVSIGPSPVYLRMDR